MLEDILVSTSGCQNIPKIINQKLCNSQENLSLLNINNIFFNL